MEDSALLFSQILSDIDQAYVDPVEPDRLFETGVRAMLGSLESVPHKHEHPHIHA